MLKPAHLADGQHKGQRGNRTHARLRHQQPRLCMLFGGTLDRFIQLADLPVQPCQQRQQIFAPPTRPTRQGEFFQISPPPNAPQAASLL